MQWSFYYLQNQCTTHLFETYDIELDTLKLFNLHYNRHHSIQNIET